MKASELVEMLQHLVDQYGDREIMFVNYTSYDGSNLIGSEVEDVTHEETGEGNPVFVLWDQ